MKQIYEQTFKNRYGGNVYHILYQEDEPTPEEWEHDAWKFPVKAALCSECNGEGQHLTPSIRDVVYTQEDFYEDPEFEERYFGGAYDVSCGNCRGKGIVHLPDIPCGWQIMEDGVLPVDSDWDHTLIPTLEAHLKWRANNPRLDFDEDVPQRLYSSTTQRHYVGDKGELREAKTTIYDPRVTEWSDIPYHIRSRLEKHCQQYLRLPDSDIDGELQQALVLRAMEIDDGETEARNDRINMWNESGGRYGRAW